MTTKSLILTCASLAILVACNKVNNPSKDPASGSGTGSSSVSYDYIENNVNLGKGIAILGDWDKKDSTPDTELIWAPVNCGYEEAGEVGSRSDHRLGKLYQWGAGDETLYKYKGETIIGVALYFDDPTPEKWYDDEICGSSADIWFKKQGPCPAGWRLPTGTEYKVLCEGRNSETGWVEKGTYAGQAEAYPGAEFFGANTDKTPGKGVFFPAAGDRRSLDGNPSGCGAGAYYWTSSTHSVATFAYAFEATVRGYSPLAGFGRSFGFSVRCVKNGK